MAIAEHPQSEQYDVHRSVCRSRGTCLALLGGAIAGGIAVIALVWVLLYNLA